MRVFKDNHGNEVSPLDPIFPILTGNPNTHEFFFVGTGFFISPILGFITAKHVMYDEDNNPLNPFFAIQTIGGVEHIVRFLNHFDPHPSADIGIGMLQDITMIGGDTVRNQTLATPLILSKSKLKVGDEVKTFAYPKSKVIVEKGGQYGEFFGRWESGAITEYLPDGRDATFLPTECYRSNALILGGASGGPVLHGNVVVGVNSTGYDLHDPDAEPISYITPIWKVFDIEVTYGDGTTASIDQLVKEGKIFLG